MSAPDTTLWIEKISLQAADSIRAEVSLFRAKRNLEGELWFIKILGTTYGQMRVWIREDKRYYGEGYTINHTLDAGIRVTEIWETPLNNPGGRS